MKPFVMLTLLCIGYLALIASTALLLPERVAMHFGLNGEADNWMSRPAAMIFWMAFGLGLPAFLMLLGCVASFLPLNIPNREYWLSPERRSETAAYLRRQMAWISCMTVLFVAGCYLLTISANHENPARLSTASLMVMTAIFLVAVAAWLISLALRFSRNNSSRHNDNAQSG